MAVSLLETIPALPVQRMTEAVDFYRDRFGFDVVHHEGGFAVIRRGEATIHLWEASDEGWRKGVDLERPICSGAESFIAGTASCRVRIEGLDELYAELEPKGVLHKVSSEGVSDTDYGTREFSTVDDDGNLISFFQWVE
jgi:catechol 2,3-dioxygenase-like lactoylglutathione lyase family enzyme